MTTKVQNKPMLLKFHKIIMSKCKKKNVFFIKETRRIRDNKSFTGKGQAIKIELKRSMFYVPLI